MKRTTTNGDKTICTKGSIHWAQNTEADDECFNPITKKDEFFENWVDTSHLKDGTTKTTIAGDPIWIQSSQVGPPSFPEQHPGIRGTRSGKPIRGEAEAVTYSGNVFAEGEPVVRVFDKTLQNSKNSHGEVLPELKRLKPKQADAGQGNVIARSAGTKGKRKRPKRDKPKRALGDLPPSGDMPVARCSITTARVSCDHNRPHEPMTYRLDVVGTGTKRLHLEGRVDGRCGREHPSWQVSPSGQVLTGEDVWVDVATGDDKAITYGVLGFQKLEDRTPVKHRMVCRGCNDPGHTFEVHAYAPGRLDDYIDFQKSKWGWPLRIYTGVLDFVLKIVGDDTQGGKKPVFELLGGGIALSAEVTEADDHRAFVAYTIDIQADPLYQSIWSFPISPKIMANVVKGVVRRFVPTMGASLPKLMLRMLEATKGTRTWVFRGRRFVRALANVINYEGLIDKASKALDGIIDAIPDPVKEAWEDAKGLGRRGAAMLGLNTLNPAEELARAIQELCADALESAETIIRWIDKEIGALGFPLEHDMTIKARGLVARSHIEERVGVIEIGEGITADLRLGIGVDFGIVKSHFLTAEAHVAAHMTGGGKLHVCENPFHVSVEECLFNVQLEVRLGLRFFGGEFVADPDKPHFFPETPFGVGPFRAIRLLPLGQP